MPFDEAVARLAFSDENAMADPSKTRPLDNSNRSLSLAGRTAQAFTRRGELNLRNARHRDDPRPIDEHCTCPACKNHSRAYLHHLIRSEEILGSMLLTWHNLHYYQDVMRDLRDAIESNSLDHWIAAFSREQDLGDIPPL